MRDMAKLANVIEEQKRAEIQRNAAFEEHKKTTALLQLREAQYKAATEVLNSLLMDMQEQFNAMEQRISELTPPPDEANSDV